MDANEYPISLVPIDMEVSEMGVNESPYGRKRRRSVEVFEMEPSEEPYGMPC